MSSIQRNAVGHCLSARRSTGPGLGASLEKPCGFWQNVEDFLLHLQASGRSSATIQSYTESLALFGGCVGNQMPLKALSTELLNAAVASMSIIGCPGGPRRSEVTLNRHRSVYRGFFRWAFETGRISTNPALLLHRARVESAPTPPITPAESRLFLRAIRRSNDPLRIRDEALFSIYAATGLRRKEALLLDQTDYDAKARLLCIRNGKGGRVRTVPVVRALGHLLEKLHNDSLSRGGALDGKLFPGRIPGSGLTARQVQNRFDLWKAVSGLRPELTIHSFRTGFATTLHNCCGDVVLVSQVLGHSDLRPTLRNIELHSANLCQIIESSLAGVLSL
jgi:site-specific recombinase XerD